MGKRSSKPAKPAGPTEVQPEDPGKEWHDKDTELYRKGYPDKKEYPEKDKNKLFYFNQHEAEPDGFKIEDIHEKWSRDYEKLEEQHGYIQWLFPIRESGLNYKSQELQLHEIEAIVGDADAKRRVLTSYKIMLDFYGMKMKSEETGELERADNWESRFKHLNESFHNYLRITRILKSIGELGYEHLKPGFVKFVVKEGFVEGTLGNMMESCEKYWIGVIRDDAIRAEILDHFNREKRTSEEKNAVEPGVECVPDAEKVDGNKPSDAIDNKPGEAEAEKEIKSNPDEAVKTEGDADESQSSACNKEEVKKEVEQLKDDKDEKSTEVKPDSASNAPEENVVEDKTPENNGKNEAASKPEDNNKDLAGDENVAQKENEEAVTKPDEDQDKETIESKTEQNDATVTKSEETAVQDTKVEDSKNDDAKIEQDEVQNDEKITNDSKTEPNSDEAVTKSVNENDKEDETIANASGIENNDSVTVETKAEPEGDNKAIAETEVKSEESSGTEKDEKSQDEAVAKDDTKEDAITNAETITEPAEKPDQDDKKDEAVAKEGETKEEKGDETAVGPDEVVDKTNKETSEQ